MKKNEIDKSAMRPDKSTNRFPAKVLSNTVKVKEWRESMRKSSLTNVTRAYFFLGAILVVAFLLTVGPYLAGQTVNVWMAFGAGLAFIAYGWTSAHRQWLGIALISLGTAWIVALIFAIFGIADL